MTRQEAVARAMCGSSGDDPDRTVGTDFGKGHPAWRDWNTEADRFIAAFDALHATEGQMAVLRDFSS